MSCSLAALAVHGRSLWQESNLPHRRNGATITGAMCAGCRASPPPHGRCYENPRAFPLSALPAQHDKPAWFREVMGHHTGRCSCRGLNPVGGEGFLVVLPPAHAMSGCAVIGWGSRRAPLLTTYETVHIIAPALSQRENRKDG